MKIIKNALLCTIVVFLASCASTNTVRIQVLQPADIYVPSHIKKVVIANRSLPQKDELVWNILEGIVTGESVFADRESSGQCINGLANELNANPRFQATLKSDNELKGTGTKKFPTVLDWSKAEEICNNFGADGLILLETFDSDVLFSKSKQDVKKTVNNKEVIVPEYNADLRMKVNAGWRIYDIKNKQIIDESVFTDEKGWNAKGETEQNAFSKLPSKRSALNESGYYAGTRFAKRISPNWIWVSRFYYVRKHDDLKKAKYMARASNWQGASEIWKKLTLNSDPKVAARACYNMAIACEIDGNLEIAITWVNKAIKEYNFKPAANYLNILNNRIAQQNKLKQQMEGN